MLGSVWLGLLVTAQWLAMVRGQACPTSGVETGEGTGVPGNNNWIPGGAAMRTYINTVTGSINCWGVVTSWKFRQSQDSDCATGGNDVSLEIWRLTAGNTYRLVGENIYDCTTYSPGGNGQEITFNIARDQRIPVQPGDFIGWTMDHELMRETNTGSFNMIHRACGGTAVGGTCNMGGGGSGTVNVNPLIHATIEQAPPPTIADLPATVSVWENEPAQAIYTVNSAHESNEVPNNVWNNQALLTYTLTQGQPELDLGAAPGAPGSPRDIRTSVALDYEAAQMHLAVVEVDAMELTATATLTVSVLDRNEVHIIANPTMTRYVSATTGFTDDLIHTVIITDVDIFNPTTKTYHLISAVPQAPVTAPADGPFYLNPTTGELRVAQDLQDFTVTSTAAPPLPDTATYLVTVSVADSMYVEYDTITVVIQNIKVPPVISNLPLATPQVLPEDALPLSSIFQATGTGPDPAQFRWSIESVSPVTHFYFFTIDTTSGEIFLSATADLDYSVENTVDVEVGLRDHLHAAEPATQNLRLDLEWRNRQPQFIPQTYTHTINENCGNLGTCAGSLPTVLTLPLGDADRDRDSFPFPPPNTTPAPTIDSLACTVEPGFGSQFFDFDPGTLPNNCDYLRLIGVINLDLTPQYEFINLTVKVSDSNGGSSIGFVNVTVLYVNDYNPVITSPTLPPATLSIPENTVGGLSILNFTATDLDLGPDGDITFHLQAVTAPVGLLDGTLYFEINATTGEVFTKQAADYEGIDPKQIEFDVFARDGGTPSRDSPLFRVIVYITDVNDNAPTWNCSNRDTFYEPYDLNDTCFYNLDIRDDTLVGYEIVQIFAQDIDTVTPTENLTFFLLTPNEFIHVQKEDGRVMVKADLEVYTEYIIYAYAQDNGDPDLWSQIMYLRIDTYDPHRQLINIIMGQRINFNDTAIRHDLLMKLRDVLSPWFPKMWSFTLGQDRTTISIYCLTDDSTYDQANLPYPKFFVDRDQLLPALRKNFLGTPKDYLTQDPFTSYNIILVEPTFPIWWIDTIPGVVTIALLCLLFVALCVGIAIGLCKKYEKLCFKKKPPARAWTQPKPPPAQPEPTPVEEPVRHRVKRAPSIDTIHSIIFDPTKERMF